MIQKKLEKYKGDDSDHDVVIEDNGKEMRMKRIATLKVVVVIGDGRKERSDRIRDNGIHEDITEDETTITMEKLLEFVKVLKREKNQ